ncbi:thioredoxin domain-containing protein [Brevibacterium daeguense]|uniref:Thioredoxin domain-containing protein n=1 Tax=Brevibacterium daeguense TaxID=909936 RepID=A0ABP8EK07_9MICO|nr:thioredoxin domain-containing protein [Brevibacterium daeguense]
MANRLADSTSPYLRQHADNPVDWWQWGPEAFASARERDVPVLISIGYSTCHWCHVMAAESFSDETTAAQLNGEFVCIKVDREELPTVDSHYMNALQAMRGAGGWPMTIFTDADGRPFFTGTYFPPTPRQGMPSFRQVLTAITNTWDNERDRVAEIAGHLTGQLAGLADAITASLPAGAADTPLTDEELTAAVEQLAGSFDSTWGGFGTAPKFPPLMNLMQLIQHAARAGDHGALDMVRTTFARIASGGMRDQVEGGIARYSVDARWHVPHFEKMLYDNALYLRAAAEWHTLESAIVSRTAARVPVKHQALAAREAQETAEFLLDSLRTPEGAFASGLDADSVDEQGEHSEGAYYTLPLTRGSELVHFAPAGNVEDSGRGVLTRPDIHSWLTDGSADVDIRPWQVSEALEEKRVLLAERGTRARPHLDDKVVTEWNGLAITALARASAVFDEPRWAEAAGEAMTALLRTCDLRAMTLPRSSRGARPGPGAAGLVDWAGLARAGLALREAGFAPPAELSEQLEPAAPTAAGEQADVSGVGDEDPWLDLALRIGRHLLGTFIDASADPVTCYDGEDEVIGARTSDPTDNTAPAGRSAAAELFLLLGELTAETAGEHSWADLGHRLLGGYRALAAQAPRGCGWALYLSEHCATGPLRVATADPELVRAALRHPAVFVVDSRGPELKDPDSGQVRDGIAVVCRGTLCSLPLTGENALIAELEATT